ncbi:PLAC8 motif-containing protein [Trypanosoma melophagium]|uniref:PLAC8 motif-containing protein n=1 Tax=Trypanosoma melophagium TaxID=715481 RepID=UPI00351A442C|nr:PLAC8 motif-containing protein [Trypanosoma melophagium]
MGYSTGICDCFSDCGGALDVYCCFPCNVSRQCNAVAGIPNECSFCYCLGVCCFPAPAMCCLRRRVSDKYSLGEGRCKTCLASTCCTVCSACQTHRELILRGANPGCCCCGTSLRGESHVLLSQNRYTIV